MMIVKEQLDIKRLAAQNIETETFNQSSIRKNSSESDTFMEEFKQVSRPKPKQEKPQKA